MTEHEYYSRWCKSLYNSVKLGGYWGIPRSGLVFKKTATGLELNELVPVASRERQLSDFDATKREFGYAGYTVTDSKGLLNQ